MVAVTPVKRQSQAEAPPASAAKLCNLGTNHLQSETERAETAPKNLVYSDEPPASTQTGSLNKHVTVAALAATPSFSSNMTLRILFGEISRQPAAKAQPTPSVPEPDDSMRTNSLTILFQPQ